MPAGPPRPLPSPSPGKKYHWAVLVDAANGAVVHWMEDASATAASQCTHVR